jgi:hypothetical protein
MVDPQPGFVLNGTHGTYIKYRVDTQQQQLQKGMSPLDPQYGIEEPGREGKLTAMDENGNITHTTVQPVPTTYLHLFEAVYQTIRNKVSYPVTEEQILKQIEILEP